MSTPAAAPRKVFLFSGHMIDAPGREVPRFPPAMEPIARRAIDRTLDDLGAGAHDLAVSSGACGGDLLFAEAALARSVPLELYLPFDEQTFAVESIDFADADWHRRFDAVLSAASVHVMPRERGALPAVGNAYEQNNVWMLEAASRFGAGRVELVCLWNGQGGDGPGGSEHLMREVRRRAGHTHWLDTRKLWH